MFKSPGLEVVKDVGLAENIGSLVQGLFLA